FEFSAFCSVFSATSMRRPVFVKYTSPSPSFEPLFGADQREVATPACRGPPFPSSQFAFRNGGRLSRARRFCAACEPLTDSLRSGTLSPRERGPGSQGACPLAEYEAAPHARRGAPSPARSLSAHEFANFRYTASRTIPPYSTSWLGLSFAARSPCFHTHSRHLFRAACKIGSFVFWRGAVYLSDGLLQRPRRGTQSPPDAAHSANSTSALLRGPDRFVLQTFPFRPALGYAAASSDLRWRNGSYTSSSTHNRCS